jgi:hypothetical protein
MFLQICLQRKEFWHYVHGIYFVSNRQNRVVNSVQRSSFYERALLTAGRDGPLWSF